MTSRDIADAIEPLPRPRATLASAKRLSAQPSASSNSSSSPWGESARKAAPPHSRAKKLTQPAPEAKPPVSRFGPPLFKADTVNLAFSADKEGRVRIVCSGWEDAKVLLAGGRLEVCCEAGTSLAAVDPQKPNRKQLWFGRSRASKATPLHVTHWLTKARQGDRI